MEPKPESPAAGSGEAVAMSTYVSAVPAYGRDYKSAKAVREDWAAGKDFLIQDINKDDKPADMVLNIRYKRLTQVCMVK